MKLQLLLDKMSKFDMIRLTLHSTSSINFGSIVTSMKMSV